MRSPKMLSRLRTLVRGDWPSVTVVLICGFGIPALQLVLPVQLGRLTNSFVGDGGGPPAGFILLAVAAFVGAQVGVAVLTFLQQQFLVRLRESYALGLVKDVIRSILAGSGDRRRQLDLGTL